MAYLLQPYSQPLPQYAVQIKQFRAGVFDSMHLDQQYSGSQYVTDVQLNDAFCLKFLQANKMNVAAAVQQFADAVKLRTNQQTDTRISRPCPQYESYQRTEQIFLHGHDKQHRPIYVQRPGPANISAVIALGTLDERIDVQRFFKEFLRHVQFPLASELAGRRVDQITCVVDMSGFGFAHLKKQQYEFVRRHAANDQVIFPQILHQLIMINTPSIFSMVWATVKGWLNEGLRQKFKVVHGNGRDVLLQEIDADQLPSFFGGSCTCNGGNCMSDHPMQRQVEAAAKTGIPLDTLGIGSPQQTHSAVTANGINGEVGSSQHFSNGHAAQHIGNADKAAEG